MRASRIQILQIGKLLEENIIKAPDGTVTYKPPWTDELIATHVKCASASVAATRREVYGNFPSNRSADGTRLDALEKLVNELVEKHDKLALLLSVNRVTDARHLMIHHEPNKGPPK